MNELGTITQDFRTPFLDASARSHALHDNTPKYRAMRKAYREDRKRCTFSPKECWQRCIGDERKE